MALEIKCPMCGEGASVPDDAILRAAQCNACKAKFFVKDAVVAKQPTPTPATRPEESTRSRNRAAIAAVGVALLLGVIVVITSSGTRTSDATSSAQVVPAPQDTKRATDEARRKAVAEQEERSRVANERQQAERKRRMDEVGEKVVERVRSQLISPASAQFSGVYVQYIERNDVYHVSGTVDSQNVYGAMLRDRFQRFMKYTGSGWTDITDSLDHEQTMALLKAASSELEATNARVQQLLDSMKRDK